MGDPVERICQFIAEQQQQTRAATAQLAWTRQIPAVLPVVEKIVAAMRDALLPEQFQGDSIAVWADPRREQFPLVIAFAPRAAAGWREAEIGASAVFRCEADGRVYGFRYPYHSVMRVHEPEQFVDLGEPEHLTAVTVGNAVAAFLEWATVGGGCGKTRLRFDPPATLPFARPPLPRSAIAA